MSKVDQLVHGLFAVLEPAPASPVVSVSAIGGLCTRTRARWTRIDQAVDPVRADRRAGRGSSACPQPPVLTVPALEAAFKLATDHVQLY